MGIIKQQSIRGTIYTYLGVGLGFITTALLFPKVLETDQVGLLRLLVSLSVLFSQFAALGFNAVTIRNFPYFRDYKNGHNGFLYLSLIVNLFGFLLSLIVYYAIHDWLIESNMQKSVLFIKYINYLIPLIFFTTLFNLLDTYNRVLYNALTGIAYKEIWQRIFILIAIIIYFFEFISFGQLVFLYVVAFSLPTILMIIMLFQKGELTLKRPGKFIDGSMKKEMASIAFFGMITSYSGVVIMNIDIVMINHFLGLSETGIYAITFYFGTLVLLPSRSVIKIASVVIADGWKNNDLEKIREIYYKSNIALTATGVFIFLGLVLNLDNIIHVLGDDYAPGKYVVLFIALAHLFEMSTGVSQNVINNSIYYRINGYLLLIFVSLLIITNWIFIPVYGIIGAAFASTFSRLIYNILSWLFLRIKFNLQPFNIKYFILAIIGGISYFVSSSIPWLNHYIIDMLVRSIIFTVIFVSGIYTFNISSDINQTIISTLKLIKLKK